MLTFTHKGIRARVIPRCFPIRPFARGMGIFGTILLARSLRVVGLMGEGWIGREAVLIAHEHRHLQQQAEVGNLRFLWNYITEWLRNVWRFRRLGPVKVWQEAYWQLGVEVEARAYAAAHWQEFVPIVRALIAEANRGA